jgi:hypothetical protein
MRVRFSNEQAGQFARAVPFPHIVLDGLFEDTLLAEVAREFPSMYRFPWIFMRNKWEHKLAHEEPSFWGPRTRALMSYLNSPDFVPELEKLTGFENLIADPTFRGGGLHLIPPGGYLKIHTDFLGHNGAFREKGWRRRINLLIFLNVDWQEAWGGHFEVWDSEARGAVSQVTPVFNRTVIFETSGRSFHGHPKPLACPDDNARRSLALYYYTMDNSGDHRSERTHFVPS